MVKKIAGWLVLVPLCVVLIAFALANRQLVSLNFNPFIAGAPGSGGGVPMFLVIYAVLLIGVLLGGTATWLAQGGHRRRERQWRREARDLGREIEALRRSQRDARGAGDGEIDDLLDVR